MEKYLTIDLLKAEARQGSNKDRWMDFTFEIAGWSHPVAIVISVDRNMAADEDLFVVAKSGLYDFAKDLVETTATFKLSKEAFDAVLERSPKIKVGRSGGRQAS